MKQHRPQLTLDQALEEARTLGIVCPLCGGDRGEQFNVADHGDEGFHACYHCEMTGGFTFGQWIDTVNLFDAEEQKAQEEEEARYKWDRIPFHVREGMIEEARYQEEAAL